MKKATESRKTSDSSLKKSLEKNSVKSSAKRNPELSQRSDQTKFAYNSQPNNSTHRNMIDKPEVQRQRKTSTNFILEGELSKLKIRIPLSKLMRKNAYRSQMIKELSIEPEIGTKSLNIGSGMQSDTINITDDQLELLFGPKVDGKTDNSVVTPFYISQNIHDKILHNDMLYSGASHNLMPKAVMEKLGLDFTRPYKDLHSFNSSKVKCIGIIKDLCITLYQIPTKSIVMDIVVADISLKYGMFLSRSWGAKLKDNF
jgi:hypothetical protein